MLLANSDFRLFLADLGSVGRQVFRDTAFALSDASRDAGKRLEPSPGEQQALGKPRGDGDGATGPGPEDLGAEVAQVADVVAEGAAKVLAEAERSWADKMQGGEKDALLSRLEQAVATLRQRPDYSDSVSTLSLLLKRYALAYSHVVQDTAEAVAHDVSVDADTDAALANFWVFLKSFGDSGEWDKLEHTFRQLAEHGRSNPDFDALIRQTGNALQDLLMDPAFFAHAEERLQALRSRSGELASDSSSSLRRDLDSFLTQVHATFQSATRDSDVVALMRTSKNIATILSPTHSYANTDLLADCIGVVVPLAVQAVRYIPIPRVELSTPQIDLLLENVILEPGKRTNVNNNSDSPSFLPFRLRLESHNGLDIRRARHGTASSIQSVVSVRVVGAAVAAEELGYWLRLHAGPLCFAFADEGIASFHLDERGIDVDVDVEIGKDRLDQMLSPRAVRVRIHRLDYTLRRSRLALLAWLFKPVIRPIVRKALEARMASAITAALQSLNRELLFARERLRAARIADPDDLVTFVRAVATGSFPRPTRTSTRASASSARSLTPAASSAASTPPGVSSRFGMTRLPGLSTASATMSAMAGGTLYSTSPRADSRPQRPPRGFEIGS